MCHLSPIIPRFVTVLRPPSDRIPSAARSDCVRCPIRLRSVSDQIAFGVRCLLKTERLFLFDFDTLFVSYKKNDSSFVFITYTKHVGYAYISMCNACLVGCCGGRRPPLRMVYSRTSSRSSGTTMRPLKCCAASRVYVSRRVASVFSSV